MRTAEVFTAGAIAGALVVWLWGKDIGDKVRGMRTQAADAIGAVEDTVRA